MTRILYGRFDARSMRSTCSFSVNQQVLWFSFRKAPTPASMNSQYCGKIFNGDYNFQRREDDRDNDISNVCSR